MRCAARQRRPQPHRQQRKDHRDVADAVDQKAPAFADGADDHARDRRADQPRGVDHRRVERDRVRQVLAPLHHLDHERLARRHVEGVDQSLHQRERDDVPDA